MGNTTMGSHEKKSARLNAKGFTLIASLLMLLLMSGMAIGLMMMVNTEGKVGGTDLQNNVAYHAAEGGIEKMDSDLNRPCSKTHSPPRPPKSARRAPPPTSHRCRGHMVRLFRTCPGRRPPVARPALLQLGTDTVTDRTRGYMPKSFR